MRILVVEDDRLLNNTLCYNLNTAGYVVDSALTKSAASDFLTKQDYDLIVLDVNLPDGNGFDFCREVKERRPDTAVIFLTANDMESDMLKGYELGAEDYVTKPFPMSVFQKKLSVVLGRLAKQSGGGDSYEDGALSINFSEMTASLSGKALVFTPLEYRLLKILTKNPQNVLTRQVLLEKLWDADGNFVDEHALTAAISRVRNKIETDGRQYIKTVYGMGYMWIGGALEMNMRKLSINKACVLLGTLLLLAVGAVCTTVYLLTRNIIAVRCVFLFSLFVLLCVIFFVALIRRKLVQFSDAFCGQMDDMLSENMQPKQTTCEESLFYKINYRLGRLYEVMQENKNSIAKERTDLQELISDISHQVKTPIANLKMINNTLLENEVPPQKQKEFLTAQASQLDKLDFLMQAMIKTSRLETGVISLEQRQQPVYDTLAAALGGILLNAEKKKIDVQVECPEHLDARHDRKWTSEALFNILDNAVKYTPAGGQIRVSVEGWEMYVKIDIADTGIGISEQHQGTIFKRFYREDVVHDVDGIGIGLYLAREIVTLQGGYIRVASEVGKGSTFSVFLLRK